jgi:hypothetical protein
MTRSEIESIVAKMYKKFNRKVNFLSRHKGRPLWIGGKNTLGVRMQAIQRIDPTDLPVDD